MVGQRPAVHDDGSDSMEMADWMDQFHSLQVAMHSSADCHIFVQSPCCMAKQAALQQTNKEQAQCLEEQADFVAALHKNPINMILTTPKLQQVSSANACVHVAASARCCNALQGMGVAKPVVPPGSSHISFQHATEAAVEEYTPDERARLLTVFPSLTHIVDLPSPASLSLQWDAATQSAHLSVCDSNGHPIIAAQPSSTSAELQHADVSVTGMQPVPMGCDSPMAVASSSVNLHTKSLRCSTSRALVTLLGCSAVGQGCGTTNAQLQYPPLLGQCLPTNLMFALLKCDMPGSHTSCAQLEHGQFRLNDILAVDSVKQ